MANIEDWLDGKPLSKSKGRTGETFWSLKESVYAMPKNPTCANCGRPMMETAASWVRAGKWEVSVFECNVCGIVFYTEDHVPLTGVAHALATNSRLKGL